MELDDRELKRLKELVPYKILSPTPDEICEEIERLNNIINELEKYCNEEIEDYDKHIKSQYITDIAKEQYLGEKVCFEDMLYKIRELKKGDEKWKNGIKE